MTRADVDMLYAELSLFARRSREMSADLHPGLSLVAFTCLSFVDDHPGVRAADIAAAWGLDKSTVSRQVAALIAADLVVDVGERPGRRGHVLELTASGGEALDRAEQSVRTLLSRQLEGWADTDIAQFTQAMQRFNAG